MPVIERLRAYFTTPPSKQAPMPLPETDVPHALGALLVRVALSDHLYAVQEISMIDKILSRFQGIGPIQAAKLRAECERLEAFAPDTPDFAFLLCRSVPYETRLEMVAALWDVVYADGTRLEAEQDVMTVTQSHLGISAEDCAVAQSRAREAAPLPPKG